MDVSNQDVDPIVTLYWRFLKARVDENKRQRIADGEMKKTGHQSGEYRQAEIAAKDARDREVSILNEIMRTPITSGAGLLLQAVVLYDRQVFFGDEPEVPGFQNLICGIRQLCSPSELAAAERLIALGVAEVAGSWPRESRSAISA